MASKDERERYGDLTGETDVPASEERFSLEEILAEYGAGREQRLMEAVEEEARQELSGQPPAEAEQAAPEAEKPAAPAPDPAPRRQEEPEEL